MKRILSLETLSKLKSQHKKLFSKLQDDFNNDGPMFLLSKVKTHSISRLESEPIKEEEEENKEPEIDEKHHLFIVP